MEIWSAFSRCERSQGNPAQADDEAELHQLVSLSRKEALFGTGAGKQF